MPVTGCGLTTFSLTRVRLIGILRDREPGMLELAQHINLEKSSASGLIDRAERRGLVARTPGPSATAYGWIVASRRHRSSTGVLTPP